MSPAVSHSLKPIAISLLLALPAMSQAAESPKELDTVVVTASSNSVQLKDAPASISVITREDLEKMPVYDLNTVLSRLPGVSGGLSLEGEQSKISLRGMPSSYTLILVDGKRVGNSADTQYRANLARQDLNWIAPDMIERIEVVRGPMSSLYGSDAMGGVINIITRKTTRQWSGSIDSNATVHEKSGRGAAGQMDMTLSGPLADNLGLRVGASVSRQNADTLANAREGGAGGEMNQNYTAQLAWQPAPGHTVTGDANYGVQESIESATQSGWGAGKLIRTSASVMHEGKWSFGKTKTALYHNHYDSRETGVTATSSDTTLDSSATLPVTWLVDQMMTVGGQWKHEQLTNTSNIGLLPIDYNGQSAGSAKLSGSTWAIFAEDQLYLSDTLTLTLGTRLDHHQKFGSHSSPRAYLVYHPASEWTVRGGISRGFRAPTLKEDSPGAATFSRGGGCGSLTPLGYTRGGCYMAGNANLKPETSINSEIGFAYEKDGWDIGMTYFHTDFSNKIDYAALGRYQGLWWTRMENIQKARISGIEGNATLPVTKTLSWVSSATWLHESRNLSNNTALLTTPRLRVSSALSWKPSETLTTELAGQYVGKQLGTAKSILKAYTLYDLSLSFKANARTTLRAGVQNLLDTRPKADGASDYYVPGRRFFTGIGYRF